ncbi:MAG: AMP-binding protein [Cellvibrio sp.]|uniref:AMP-binding protein n=1 Tax=Cellvibrio sp. TaxID=1965322 RepID=UPI0031A598BA
MITPLRHLFAAPADAYAGSRIVALDGAEVRTWAQLCMRIAAWEQALAEVDGDLIALYQRDSFEFMAALAALWRLGKKALVPANNLPASCTQLAAITPHFAGDFPHDQVISAPTSAECSLASIAVPDIHAPALILFTSGSTGNPEPVAKSFAQLESELSALETQWGSQLGDATITSSVSHHHIYGLLFRLFWPLCSGRPLVARERDYWEELAEDARQFQRIAIISSPAHLSRIPPLDWPEQTQIAAIFSSGAPLAIDAALAAKARFGHAVTEVYGSTETGGIGWREQDQGSVWTCLPDVQIALITSDDANNENQLLQVRSKHLADDNWYTSADRASLDADGRFSLCGRADRIAKVGGKRISLSAIERILEQQQGVAQARVIMLPERGDRLGAVVVLDNDGNKRLVDQGKNGINQQFKNALENTVDRVAIPRYWRYLGELPRNRQGKTTQADLAQLFSTDELPRLPELVASEQQGDALLLSLFIPANLYYFDGHFPGRPVLPGVVQTHWAVHYGREHWGDLGQFTALEAVKFQQVVTANQTLLLRLEYQPDKGKLYFTFTSKGTFTSGSAAESIAHASGRVVFEKGQAR